jgi:Family of unknown function (DUF6077)
MFEASIVLLSAVALLTIGPLRSALTQVPPIAFLATLFLFMVPGVLLSHWLLAGYASGPAMLPVSFVISAGLFGILGVPMLTLHHSLESYLWIVRAVVAASLATAVFVVIRRKPLPDSSPRVGSRFIPLWIPFLLLSAGLTFVSRARLRGGAYGDIWVYLAWVREFLSTDKLGLYEPFFGREASLSRAQINAWLLEQAALSRISGIDPIALVFDYLAPTLVVISLLAFYALARTLFKSAPAALLASCLYALFFLVSLSPEAYALGGQYPMQGGFVSRAAEDKFLARFLFLPVALVLAFAFLESRKWRYLAAFTFTCWAVMTVHPVGLAIIGLSMAGFGLVYVALNWRRPEAWKKMASLGAALLSVVVVPALYVLTTGNSLATALKSADISSGDPDVLANMVFVMPERMRIFELGEGLYIMHPSLLLNPVFMVAYLLGVPFLLWRLRTNVAAQLLLGVLLVSVIVCYVPAVATFVGDRIVLPGQLWRLAWPIPLAALLVDGWMLWEASRRLEGSVEGTLGVGVGRYVPLVLVLALMVVTGPMVVAGAKDSYEPSKVALDKSLCLDPVLCWMRDNLTEPSVVLAPDAQNLSIPAYSASANVVSLRGSTLLEHLDGLERRAPGEIEVPQGVLDVRTFFHSSALEEKVEIVRRHEVDYVIVRAGSPLEEMLERKPGFTAVDTPGERHSLYVVNRRKLG